MTAASLPSVDDLSRLADELEGLVALYEQRGGTVFPVRGSQSITRPPIEFTWPCCAWPPELRIQQVSQTCCELPGMPTKTRAKL